MASELLGIGYFLNTGTFEAMPNIATLSVTVPCAPGLRLQKATQAFRNTLHSGSCKRWGWSQGLLGGCSWGGLWNLHTLQALSCWLSATIFLTLSFPLPFILLSLTFPLYSLSCLAFLPPLQHFPGLFSPSMSPVLSPVPPFHPPDQCTSSSACLSTL